MNSARRRRMAACAALLGLLAVRPVLAAQEPQVQDRDLTELSLEELSKMEVTSASRKEQRLEDVPAAVFVIRGEDIRRTGVRSIPEALRMAPGVQVARIDANKWSISIRGFSDRFGNKLQVLVDGRSVYSPLFSGVFWDAQDTNLDDVDRIEVIRGPGASVWGANAVNGVINIITKKAKETQGGQAVAGGGTTEKVFAGGRYGGSSGDGFFYRAFAKYFDREGGVQGKDDWHQARAGFRSEAVVGEGQTVTTIGEFYQGQSGSRQSYPMPPPVFLVQDENPYDLRGGFLLGRYDRRVTDTSSLSAQVSYTYSELDTGPFAERRHVVDIDATHQFRLTEEQDVIWGLGYRITGDDTRRSFLVSFDPDEETDDVLSLFVQDEIRLIPGMLWGTVGARLEHNDYTGLEVQASARLGFRPHEHHMFWAAWSRATRTPSRTETDIRLTQAVIPANPPGQPLPTYVAIFGGDFESELLNAYEIGYRVQPATTLSLDLTGFYNRYERLSSTESSAPFLEPAAAPDHVVLPFLFDNRHQGATYGFEAAFAWQIQSRLRLQGSYTLLRMNLQQGNSTSGVTGSEGNAPRGRAYARISYDLSDAILVDVMGRFVSHNYSDDINSYVEADARIAWRPTKDLEIALVGQNLLHARHFESGDSGLNEEATRARRGVYASLTLKF
jgi:iron complex outermembrane recepter protein